MKYSPYVFLLLIFTFLSCRSNSNDIKKIIIGTWDVYGSEINNRPNGFMSDAWFTFNSDNTVTSNLFEEGHKTTYHIESNRLLIDSEDKLDLHISKLGNDTLLLEGKLKIYQMEYFMKRRKY